MNGVLQAPFFIECSIRTVTGCYFSKGCPGPKVLGFQHVTGPLWPKAVGKLR